MIEYRTGDMFDCARGTILAHACNGQGVWGSGVAAEFARRFPSENLMYRRMCEWEQGRAGYGFLAGNIGCLVTSRQYGYKKDEPPIILDQTGKAVWDLLKVLPANSVVHSPKINSGLFAVPWNQTAAVIEGALDRCNYILVKPIRWVVWELPTKDPAVELLSQLELYGDGL